MLLCPGEVSRLCLRVVGSRKSSCLALPGKGGEEKEEGELEHGCIWGHLLGSGEGSVQERSLDSGVCVCVRKGCVFIA